MQPRQLRRPFKGEMYHAAMDEGRKRVLLIAASILLRVHLKDDLSARSQALVANAFRLAERTT